MDEELAVVLAATPPSSLTSAEYEDAPGTPDTLSMDWTVLAGRCLTFNRRMTFSAVGGGGACPVAVEDEEEKGCGLFFSREVHGLATRGDASPASSVFSSAVCDGRRGTSDTSGVAVAVEVAVTVFSSFLNGL